MAAGALQSCVGKTLTVASTSWRTASSTLDRLEFAEPPPTYNYH
jgi:hypothetical protein